MIEAPLVKQTSTTTGTGNLTLAAAETGFRRFLDVMTAGSAGGISGEDWAPYMARTADGAQWEMGISRIFNDAGEGELARSTAVILESSNAGALVNFTADTTIRLIKAPNLDQYKRGVKVFLSATQGIDGVGFSNIDWEAEQTDTDNCWSVTNADRIYIPAWADEVELFFWGETSNADKTDLPVIARVDGVLTERGNWGSATRDLYIPINWIDSATTLMHGGGHATFRVERASVDINNRAWLEVEESDPSNSALVWTNNTRAWLRVIR